MGDGTDVTFDCNVYETCNRVGVYRFNNVQRIAIEHAPGGHGRDPGRVLMCFYTEQNVVVVRRTEALPPYHAYAIRRVGVYVYPRKYLPKGVLLEFAPNPNGCTVHYEQGNLLGRFRLDRSVLAEIERGTNTSDKFYLGNWLPALQRGELIPMCSEGKAYAKNLQ